MTNKKENNKLEEKTRPIKINYPEVKNILLRYGESRYRCGVAEGQGDLSPEDSYPHGSAYRDVDELISQYGEACREEERREIEETIVKTYRQHPMPSQQVILKTLNQDNNNNDE